VDRITVSWPNVPEKPELLLSPNHNFSLCTGLPGKSHGQAQAMSQAEGDFEAAVYASRFGGGSLNLFGTVSTKTSSNCPLMASRGFAAWGDTSPARRRGGAIKAGARKPRSNIDLNHFRQKSCLFWPLEPRRGDAYTTPGMQGRAALNGLAHKWPSNPMDVAGPSRHLRTWLKLREQAPSVSSLRNLIP
jgi:hypothetical protein